MPKFVIYQVLPRLFGNYNTTRKYNGTIAENGSGKFNSFTTKALNEIKKFGATHIWYTGILEHATKTNYTAYGILQDHPGVVKGNAGSPYAVKDYYDVSPDLAENIPNRMDEFEALIKRTHQVGLKAIIDFIPNHVARQYKSDKKPAGINDLGEKDNVNLAFSPQNNFYYIPNQIFNPSFYIEDYKEFPAKATGNDQFTCCPTQFDWYETIKLNYGVDYVSGREKHFNPTPDTWYKMLDILTFWANKNVDGFRVDMAEMVPVEFWGWIIPKIKTINPDIIFIAEVYNPAEYHNYISNGKFDYLYDKVGMYDKLRGIVSKNEPARDITRLWQNLNGIENNMLHFLENHDEQRIASGFFCGNGSYAKPAMVVAATLTKSPVMIYFGQELGELGMDMEGFSGLDGKTSIFDYWNISSMNAWANNGKFDGASLNDEQKKLREFYKILLHICTKEKAITDGLMYDLEYANISDAEFFNSHEQFAYFRKYENDILLIVLNFDDKPMDMRINVPAEAFMYLGMEENAHYKATNLLNAAEEFPIQILSSINQYRLFMPPWEGKILKLKRT
ncbi:Alpha amylase catalytic region [uncultured Paludibacter sp.]|uniref:Alpha amylase catalytic region n=1 Tax=uncultured Paludibacter sp. TaxID=497635 RepID=A0A653AKR2_9BACT|nr:Alpha amylase catalytic region [uncultured Paludibacter sp.]